MEILLLFLIGTLVLMFLDYKKFYIYLLAFVGMVLQIFCIYPFDLNTLQPIVSFACGLVPVLLIFIVAFQRRKNYE